MRYSGQMHERYETFIELLDGTYVQSSLASVSAKIEIAYPD